MSAADDVRRLVAEVNYPPDDPRHVIGDWCVFAAEQIDAGTANASVHSWRGLLRYGLDDVTMFPNDPPGLCEYYRCRILENWIHTSLHRTLAEKPPDGFLRRPDGELVDCRRLRPGSTDEDDDGDGDE